MFTSFTIDRKDNLFRCNNFISGNIYILISTGTNFFLIQYLRCLLASILQAKIERLFLALEQIEDESSEEGSKGI